MGKSVVVPAGVGWGVVGSGVGGGVEATVLSGVDRGVGGGVVVVDNIVGDGVASTGDGVGAPVTGGGVGKRVGANVTEYA